MRNRESIRKSERDFEGTTGELAPKAEFAKERDWGRTAAAAAEARLNEARFGNSLESKTMRNITENGT
jgi:hypothetical protein